MTVDKVELRRLAEGCVKHGDNWYESGNIEAFPEFLEDRDFVIAANPKTVLALLDEIERAYQAVNSECQDWAREYEARMRVIAERDAALAELEALRIQVSTLTEWYSNALDVISEVSAAIPGVTYMDPPDGGDVSIPEQIRRMAKDAGRYRWLCRSQWYAGPWPDDEENGYRSNDKNWTTELLSQSIDAAMAHAKENGND